MGELQAGLVEDFFDGGFCRGFEGCFEFLAGDFGFCFLLCGLLVFVVGESCCCITGGLCHVTDDFGVALWRCCVKICIHIGGDGEVG